jgi:hypothetical protein
VAEIPTAVEAELARLRAENARLLRLAPSPPPACTAWSCSAMRVAAKKGSGEIKDSVEVIDVAQLLVRSVARKAASPNGADTDAD